MPDDQDEARPIASARWHERLNDPRHHRATWRPVAARIDGMWRWAILRAWFATDDGWICCLEWGDDQVRGGAIAGWYEYSPRSIRPLPPLPADWQPPTRSTHKVARGTRAPGAGGGEQEEGP